MEQARIRFRRYGSGRADFSAACSARYVAVVARALQQATRIAPFVDEKFLADSLAKAGVPHDVLTEVLLSLTIDDDVYLMDDTLPRGEP